MEALQIVAKTSDGNLSIVVPENFRNADLEITIQVKPKQANSDDFFEEVAKRRMEHFGKAPFPDFPISKYDVYNQ